jgi:hypothetical protein
MAGKRKMINGVPCFKVDADDFMYIAACATMNKRLLSKNIKNDELREFYISSRVPKFTIDYNGVILSW